MIAELVTRRRLKGFYEALQSMDAQRIVSFWPEDFVMEFQPGLPFAGRWKGRAEVRAVFEAIFAHNARIETELRHVAIERPWSPTGRSRYYCEWLARETGTNGHVVETLVVSVAETRRWRTVHSTDYFANLPGMAEHYGSMEVPARPQQRAVVAAA
jgi:hypothetical protein